MFLERDGETGDQSKRPLFFEDPSPYTNMVGMFGKFLESVKTLFEIKFMSFLWLLVCFELFFYLDFYWESVVSKVVVTLFIH